MDFTDFKGNLQNFHLMLETQCKAVMYDLSEGEMADVSRDVKLILQQSKAFIIFISKFLHWFEQKNSRFWL